MWRTIIMEEKGVQTEGRRRVDAKKIEAEITNKFETLFNNLFSEKMDELRNDNNEFREFLKEKAEETNNVQTEYNGKLKEIQNEIYNKFKTDILKKWKDDVMDVCEQLDEHGTTIQTENEQNYQRNLVRNLSGNVSDDIVNQISSLLNDYQQHN